MRDEGSAAPLRAPGTRSRAGNAMGRTRLALLEGAVRAIEKQGVRRTSMAELATVAGIAKGTLYNHFRTKEDVWAAAIAHELDELVGECGAVARDEGLSAGLARAADRLGAHAALRRIAAEEPAVLARLATVGEGDGWQRARRGVGEVLGRADEAAVELALRWLVSFVGAPGRAAVTQAGAEALVDALAALPLTPPGEDAGPTQDADHAVQPGAQLEQDPSDLSAALAYEAG